MFYIIKLSFSWHWRAKSEHLILQDPLKQSHMIKSQLYSTFKSFNNSAMSMWGLLLVPVLLVHSALCRLLADCFVDERMRSASVGVLFFSPRQHRRTSLTSPSIFLERMVGNTALTRSETLFLKAESRHTRFRMNTPGPMAGRERSPCRWDIFQTNHTIKREVVHRRHGCWREINDLKYFTSGGQQAADFLQDRAFNKGSRWTAHPHSTVFIVYIEHDGIKQTTPYRGKGNSHSHVLVLSRYPWVCPLRLLLH